MREPTMRGMNALAALSLLMAWSVVGEAAERPGVQKARCAVATTLGTNGELTTCSGSAEVITGIALSCTGTACGASLYDSSDPRANVANSNIAFEVSAVANGTTYINVDPPIRTTNGVQALLDANGRAIVVFTEQVTP